MQKRFTEASLLALLSLLMMQSACGVAESPRTRYRPGRIEFDWSSHSSLATDSRRTLEDRLDHDVEILIVKLQDVVITDAVVAANATSSPSFARRTALERRWKASEEGAGIVETHTDSACGRALELLVREHEDFEEIIVTDLRGLVVCQSRMAEHFFYGDEKWWRECVETGRLSHSRLVFDEATRSVGLSIFAPVRDPSTNDPIGVARAMVRRREVGG